MTATTEPNPAVTSVREGLLMMYTTVWCGYCRRLKAQMDRAGIGYVEVDIEQDPAAAEYVREVNAGNQTVPTLVLPDGRALTNPSLAQLQAALGG
ncbi:MAG: mycoredoxin [Actinomycetes bacterium]